MVQSVPAAVQDSTNAGPPPLQPPRVVSLLPSATEIVCLAGAEAHLVARSHECDHPPTITGLPALTAAINGPFTTSREVHDATCGALESGRGLYTIDAQLLASLRPTVIVTQDLCEVCSVDLVTVERVVAGLSMEPPPQIISLNPRSVKDVIMDTLRVGRAVGTLEAAQKAVDGLLQRLADLQALATTLGPPKLRKVAFLEWTDPLFCGGHWTPALVDMAGGSHPLNLVPPGEEAAGPSFAVEPEAVMAADPDVIIICPCGLDVPMAKIEAAPLTRTEWWPKLRAVQAGAVFLVDGNAHFNRPGPRLLDDLAFLIAVLHERWDLMAPGYLWDLMDLKPSSPATAGAGLRAGGVNNGAGAQEHISPAAKATEASHSTASRPQGSKPSHGGDATERGAEEPEADGLAGFQCAPGLPPDVEEAYMAAVACGKLQYRDPITGYQCFTEAGLRARETCCGNRCRHCPFGHFRVLKARKGPRLNRITQPALLVADSYTTPGPRITLLAVAAGDAPALEQQLAAMQRDGPAMASVVVLVAVDFKSRAMWAPCAAGSSGASLGIPAKAESAGSSEADQLSDVMDVCLHARVTMAAVPVRASVARGLDSAVGLALYVVQQAQGLMAQGCAVSEVVGVGAAAEVVPCLPWLPASCGGKAGASEPARWAEVPWELPG